MTNPQRIPPIDGFRRLLHCLLLVAAPLVLGAITFMPAYAVEVPTATQSPSDEIPEFAAATDTSAPDCCDAISPAAVSCATPKVICRSKKCFARLRAALRRCFRPRRQCGTLCRVGCDAVCDVKAACNDEGKEKSVAPDPYAWRDLFDGETLDGWKVPEFGGEGEVMVEDGVVVLAMGSSMTGITYTGEVPRDNYEVTWEAVRLDGCDFFATCTFPVGDDECSLVTGGWGGAVTGLSCIDSYAAVDNETLTIQQYDEKEWYTFRVRVTEAKIEAWLDGKQVVDQAREGHTIGIRDEVDMCRPLGISSWCTEGGVRSVHIRNLKPVAPKQQAE